MKTNNTTKEVKMTYPKILNCDGNIGLLTKEEFGISLSGLPNANYGLWTLKGKNITREYLANTKVKIESEEHGEFVIKLFNNAFDVSASPRSPKWVYNDGKIGVSQQLHGEPEGGLKLITLPLPHKESEEWPAVGEEVFCEHQSGQKKTGELLALTKEYAIIQQEGYEQHLYLKSWELSKPLTPEEELAKEIEEMLSLTKNAGKRVLLLIDKYEIKKKPE